MKRPKVLIIEAAPAVGGSLTSIEVVIRKGIEEGIEFALLSRFDSSPFVPDGVRHYRLPSGHGKRGLLYDWAVTQWRLRKESFDLVILNNLLSANFASLVGALVGRVPVIQFARAYERSSKSWRWLSPLVDAFVPVSQSVADVLRELGVSESRLHLAYEGISLGPQPTEGERTNIRQQWGIPESAQVAGFVGRLVPWKGYDLFVEAAILCAQRSPQFYALIVGGATPEEEARLQRFKERIETLGLAKRLLFTGEQKPEVARGLFAALDIFAHCSVTPEPFGRVLLEAMSVGIPTISCAQGGPQEILTSGEDGLLVAAEPREFADAMQSLLDDPAYAAELGRRGRETVSQRFHEGVCAAPVLALIHSLAARSSRPNAQRHPFRSKETKHL